MTIFIAVLAAALRVQGSETGGQGSARNGSSADSSALEKDVRAAITASGAEVAVALRTLDGRTELSIDADMPFHAASTMKVPVMIELFRQAAEGRFPLEDPLRIRNQFSSIVGPPWRRGSESVRQGAEKHDHRARPARRDRTRKGGQRDGGQGNDRGAEAPDLQRWHPGGPARRDPVAHKTGSITRTQHDAGIVYAARPYTLVILVRGIDDQKKSKAPIAKSSRIVYDAVR